MTQGRYWLLTIPKNDWQQLEQLPDNIQYLRGQLERGAATAYEHWQLLVAFKRHVRLAVIKRHFGNTCHAELTRSNAADDYVWKDDTAVPNTRFQLGKPAIKRNSETDWATVLDDAKSGRMDNIPADIVVRWVFSGKVIFP
jgi:hypothetical protein